MLYINDSLFSFDIDEALARLTPQRRDEALRYSYELGRRTCVAAYLLLCQGLEAEYGIEEKPVFGFGEHGKPHIIGHEDIHFNLSHCREAAACYVSDRPVGIDIESIRPARKALVEYTMNAGEVEDIMNSPEPDRAFTRLWTRKEAVLKLDGTGISNDIKDALVRDDVVFHTTETDRYVLTVCQYVRRVP